MNKFAFLVVGLVLALSACDGSVKSSAKKSTISEKMGDSDHQPGVHYYVAGGELNYLPLGFRDERGRATGFELELLQAVAKASNFNVRVVNVKRATLEDSLNQNQIDIGVSALVAHAERRERLDMSDTYLEYEKVIYALDKGIGLKINSLSDLKGKRIAYYKGSKSGIALATELSGSEVNAISTASVFLSLKEMIMGKADASIGEERIFQHFAHAYPEFKGHAILVPNSKPGGYAFAVKKGNQELLQKLNDGLAKVKANGTLNALLEKWFGKPVQKK